MALVDFFLPNEIACSGAHCFLPERHQSALPVLALDSHVRLYSTGFLDAVISRLKEELEKESSIF